MKNIVFLILFGFLVAGCCNPAPPATLPQAKHSPLGDGKVTVEGITVANRLDTSDVKIVPAEKWKDIEKRIISGGKFDKVDMTLGEMVSLLGPAYHRDESLQIFYWYFSDGRMLSVAGLYRFDNKPASIRIEKYDSKTFLADRIKSYNKPDAGNGL